MKIRYTFNVFVISLLFLFPIQWISIANPTGTIAENEIFLTGLFILAVLGIWGISFFSKNLPKGNLDIKSLPMTIIFAATALFVVYEGAISLVGYLALKDIPKELYELVNESSLEMVRNCAQNFIGFSLPESIAYKMMTINGNAALVYAGSCVLGALGFALMAFVSKTGKKILTEKPTLALLPTIWGIVRLAVTFMYYTKVAKISANIMDILAVSLSLIFLFSQAKIFANTKVSSSIKTAVSMGLVASLSIAISSVIRYVMHTFAAVENASVTLQPSAIDVMMMVMMIAYLWNVTSGRMTEQTSESPEMDEDGEFLDEYASEISDDESQVM